VERDGRDAQLERGAPGQRAEAAVHLHVLPLHARTHRQNDKKTPSDPETRGFSLNRETRRAVEEGPDLYFAEFSCEGAGEGDGAEERDDAADGSAAGQAPAPVLHLPQAPESLGLID
jgi:hypothetical protein